VIALVCEGARERGRHDARCHAVAVRACDRVGTVCELPISMMAQTTQAATSASEQDLRPRARTLSWMASLSVAAGELRAAEGYLLELLAWCAFGDRETATAAAADSEM
jgi:hypothetical protein